MKKQLIPMVVVVFSVLLVGCNKLEVTTQIKANGSGDLITGVGFSAEERKNLEEQNNNADNFCSTDKTLPNVVVTEEQRGDETWCITTTQFDNLSELQKLYQQRKGLMINQLEFIEQTLFYDISIDTSSEDSDFSSLTEIKWSVVMPDAPFNYNADEVNGNKLTWLPTPKNGVFNINAQSNIPNSGLNLPICNAAFIGLFAIVLYKISRPKKL
jgi:hypothetical protein